jgi:hypothetical protein
MDLTDLDLPDFFLLGFPKCGTTTLSYWLSQSPEICQPKIKEPKILSYDDRINDNGFYDNFHQWKNYDFDNKPIEFLKKYNTNFSGTGLKFDATPHYCISSKAFKRIKKYTPEAKFLFILRNPTDMVLSSYRHNLKARNVSFPIKKYLRYQHQRALEYGSYFEHIDKWLSHYDRSQFHFLTLEGLRENPQKELDRIALFLEIQPWEVDFQIKNKSTFLKSTRFQYLLNGLSKLLEPNHNTKTAGHYIKESNFHHFSEKVIKKAKRYNQTQNPKKMKVSKIFRQQLDFYFERENNGLSKLINIDLKKRWKLNI